jgi:hypothetical protein
MGGTTELVPGVDSYTLMTNRCTDGVGVLVRAL